MIQLFRDAWLEWQSYTSGGKLAALLLVALLYLWFGKKCREQKAFLLYTTVMTVSCILPVTAGLLWVYQTKFYDYKWIWSLVPQTAVTAYGVTLFLEDYWAEAKELGWRRSLPLMAMLLSVILLCGGSGTEVWDREGQTEESCRAQEMLAGLEELCPDGDICLWAPREILEYAREIDATVRLPYGRNMWDISLNAYTYDIYDEDMIQMYQWMENIAEGGAEEMQESVSDHELPKTEECVACALSAGVNCIMLPQEVEEDTLQRIEELLGVGARPFGEYYILIL